VGRYKRIYTWGAPQTKSAAANRSLLKPWPWPKAASWENKETPSDLESLYTGCVQLESCGCENGSSTISFKRLTVLNSSKREGTPFSEQASNAPHPLPSDVILGTMFQSRRGISRMPSCKYNVLTVKYQLVVNHVASQPTSSTTIVNSRHLCFSLLFLGSIWWCKSGIIPF